MEQSFEFGRRIGMLAALWIVPAGVTAYGATKQVAHLPNVKINAAKVDAAGNVYLAGQSTTAAGTNALYVSKLSSDGATTYYAVTIGGNGAGSTAATALNIDSTGAAYIAGTTTAADFPVSPGSVRSTGGTEFAVKLDAKGNFSYSALIGDGTEATPNSVVVNSQGELVVSGMTANQASRLLKVSANGSSVIVRPAGIGGLLTIDSQDNVYIAGAAPSSLVAADAPLVPAATPGAFQGTPAASFCGSPFFALPCFSGDQFVASLSPDLSKTRFLTYATSKYGATPAFLALDTQGNILVAGTTASPGYPTTSGSYLPNYTAASGTAISCGPPIPVDYTYPSGYVTLMKPDGTGLLFSTFFSGSKNDTISFAALTGTGIYLAGQAGSVDLPGFDGAVPPACTPLGFVTRMTLDGAAVSSSRTPPGRPLAYDSSTKTLLLSSGSYWIRFDASDATPIACVLDSSDLKPVTAIAPGELLSLLGRFPYYESYPYTSSISPVDGTFPVTFQKLTVMANDIAAPLLYISRQQVNFQAPYELAGSPGATLTLNYLDPNSEPVSDARTLSVTATNPVAFLSQTTTPSQTTPLILNADGTVNSATNPAAAGSVVTMFMDGLGTASVQPATGVVNANPKAPLSAPIAVIPSCAGGSCFPAPSFVAAESLPGAISGVTQVQLRAPDNSHPAASLATMFSLSAGDISVRDTNLLFWVK